MRFLSFDSLITPSIVRLLFYCCVALACIGAIVAYNVVANFGAMSGMGAPSGPSVGGMIVALVVAAVGILVSRIAAEMILVVFMIRDELAWQRLNLSGTVSQAAAE